MKSPILLLVLTLVVCTSCVPAPPHTPTPLPEEGRAIQLFVEDGEYDGQTVFDVVEVVEWRVRLREPLCDHDDPGTWVEWERVISWEDVGSAWGDNWDLGVPVDVPYGLDSPYADG